MTSESDKKSFFAQMWVFIRPFRRTMIALFVLTGFLTLSGMLWPLLMRALINDAIGNHQTDIIWPIALVFLVTTSFEFIGGYVQVTSIAYLGQAFVMRIRCAVYNRMLYLSMSFFSRESTGKLVNRLMGDSGVLQQMLSVTSMQVITDLISAVFAVSATLFINWRLAIPLYALAFLFALNYRFCIGKLRRLARNQRNAEDRVASGVQNRLVANLTVKTYGMESRESDIFHDESMASLELGRESAVASSDFWRNSNIIRDAGYVIIFYMGCRMVLNGTASYGDVTAFLAYSMSLLWPAVRFSLVAQQLQNVRISADRLFEILEQKSEVEDRPGAVKMGTARGHITIEDVHFSYTPEKEVIKGISLDVEEGETIALVGSTGCGKSTVLSLLMRLYDVTSGRILIDGKDIRDVTLQSLRRNYGIVLQESMLFTVSIADNIRYGKPNASFREVKIAARIAEIDKEIMELPRGYDSRFGDYDVQLSVGQKQRIAIARAILADPAILIMDEATSALDTNSERAIQIALDRFLTGRTAFIVAHRLSTIRNASRIIYLDDGKIIECGSHEELMKIPNGRYHQLYEAHAGTGTLLDKEG